jgi:hypothetical protein
VLDEVRHHFLGVEAPAGIEHPADLAERRAPVRHVVDDPEVEDGVVRGVRRVDPLDVADPEPHPLAAAREAPARELDHLRVEVEGVDARRAEAVEDQLDAHAAPAAHLQRGAAVEASAQLEQARGLEAALDRGANRVVHHQRLDRIEQHGSSSDQSGARRRRSALAITDTDERLMAAAANIGESRRPVNGKSTPAATGTPRAL